LENSVVFLYAGTLGKKHDPKLLIDLATDMRHSAEVRVVVCSEGPVADDLARRAAELAIENLVVLPFQPYEELSDVLGTADVLLVMLESAAGYFSVPSKVLTSLCAGRPILGSMPRDNLASRTIQCAGAGAVTEPDDRAGFLAAARSLLDANARHEGGAAARSYAERTFAKELVTDRFEAILTGVVQDQNSRFPNAERYEGQGTAS
jgi:glycosyltransferase involved in cell wall biosynthesis